MHAFLSVSSAQRHAAHLRRPLAVDSNDLFASAAAVRCSRLLGGTTSYLRPFFTRSHEVARGHHRGTFAR